MVTESDVREALRMVSDPEIGVNIVDLGLVYRIEVEGPHARVTMTMTSPACPLANFLKQEVVTAVRARVPGITDVDFILAWEPPWSPAMMSDEARRQLDEGER